ncbi:MAG TPA: FxsB family cyclophane-forming radical SAM/SPASM peptide maturase [Trebonia sp.]|nr:FxsB family cyclophane-forming radical SAM/SPASM peptide maturase [Trebonia sp.]
MDGRVLIPADQFVIKVHSRCDLACDHCYVYESIDQSWRGRPMAIQSAVVSQTASRIAEHVKKHELGRVEIVLHGGEPLLAGVDRLGSILDELKRALGDLCRLDIKVHTNGVRLDEEFCELFDKHGVGVGISIDGDRAANDRHRKYSNGNSSYDAVIRAISLLASDRFRHLYSGLLCTIDVANDPIRVYESLLELAPPRLDLLLPHATWDAPPPGTAGTGTEYADWLIAIFDRWQADGFPVRIRTFDSIIATLAGGDSRTEALGLAPVRMVVVETDGSYEQADSLKVTYDGAPSTGLDVFTHSLDSVMDHPGIATRQGGIGDLSATCQQCPVVSSCGGGMYAHRYKSGSGFDNPSVYCADLLKLISHIGERLPHVARSVSHVVSDEALAELAGGMGGASAIAQLTQAQRSLRRGLLTAVYQAGIAAPAVDPAVRDRLSAAWKVLAAADDDSHDAIDTVLGHPYLRVWAVRCLDRLGRPGGAGGAEQHDGASLAADLGHLAAIAAAVAIRGQARALLTVPVIGGAVHLPGLGRLAVGPGDEALAVLEVDADWVRVRVGQDIWRLSRPRLLAGEALAAEPCQAEGVPDAAGRGVQPAWEPVRVLTAPGIRVVLEDTDPYRDCHQWPAAPRLSDEEFTEWQRGFALAWREIQTHHPAYAPALAAGLTTLMPMTAGPAGSDVSAAARHGFGAVGTALPGDPVTLALLLMHEFQHVKLGAVLDLYDLFDPDDKQLYHAPWRKDPRPLEGLLQGTYAHLAVSEFWRVRAGLGECDQAEAAERYEHWRAHTAAAIETLANSDSLTPLGMRFADAMRTAIAAHGDARIVTSHVTGV